MEIISVDFEQGVSITINGEKVTLIAFKTLEPGNIKIGVNGPRSLSIDREEIYHQKKLKLVHGAKDSK